MTKDEYIADTSETDVRAELDAIRGVGAWMAWAGFVCALFWWGGIAGILIGLFGVEQLLQQPPGVLVGAGSLILLPGFLMTLAGLMARQSRKAAETNALVLRAAQTLLTPAKTAEQDIRHLADAMRTYSETVNRTATDALSSLKTAGAKLENERLRVESVSYAMADNARDLTQRLKEERHAIEVIAKNLDMQTRGMADAIPRQASEIAAAAKKASEEVAEADTALERQVHRLKNAGSTLAVRLSDLDAVAKDAASRTETLGESLGRIEAKLGESQKTVEMAERASAMAVDAASGAGDALKDAVSAALDSARAASTEIADTTRKVHEDAARTLSELKQASVEAGAAASETGATIRTAASRATLPPAPASQAAPKAVPNGQASNGQSLRGRGDLNGSERRPEPARPLRPTNGGGPLPPPSAPTASDDDLFDSPDDAPAPVITSHHPTQDVTVDRIDAPANGHDSTAWRNIIADLEDDEARDAEGTVSDAPLAREETAEQLMNRLETSGIPLPKAFKPRDKKRIAAAARKDEKARRSATRQAAGPEVDRVAVRLRKDSQLLRLAQHFVIAEEPEALLALDKTSNSRRPASPRLSAYLLVDAALEAVAP